MIQELGINISAQGAQNVANEFSQISTKLSTLKSEITGLNTVLSTMGAKFESVFTKVSKIEGVGAHVTNFANRSKGALSGLNVEINTLKSSMDRLAQSAKTMGPAGGVVGGGGSGRGGMFAGMGAFGFMARWMAYQKMMQAGAYGVTELAMGGARKDVAQAGVGLASVGMSKDQRALIEKQGHAFSQQFPMTNAAEFMNTAGQVASALDTQKLGAGQIARMTETDIIGAKLSKMATEKFSENMSKIENSYLSSLPANMGKALREGQRVNLPGYGMTDYAGFHEKNVAKMAKVVEITNMWGQGAMDFMSYAGSIGFAKGQSLDHLLAYAGALTDAGYKGAKAGRSYKDLMVGREQAMANILSLGDGTFKMGMSGKEKKEFDEQQKSKRAYVNQMLSSEEGSRELFKQMIPGMAKGLAAGKDPEYALSMLKDLGLSKEFIPQFMSTISEGFVDRLKEITEQLKNADMAAARKKAEDAMTDAGFNVTRLSNAWSGLATSMATAVANNFDQTGIINTMNNMKAKIDANNQGNSFDKLTQKLSDEAQERHLSGKNLQGFYREKLNEYLEKRFKDESGLFQGSDAEKAEKRAKLRSELETLGRTRYREMIGPQGEERISTPWVEEDALRPAPDPKYYKGYNYKWGAPGAKSLEEGLPSEWPQNNMNPPQQTIGSDLESIWNRAKGAGSGIWDWFNAPPPTFDEMNPPGPQSQAEPTPVNNDVKVTVYVGDRELRDIVTDVVSEQRFSGRGSYGGSGLVGA